MSCRPPQICRALRRLYLFWRQAPQKCRGKLSLPRRLWIMRQRCKKVFCHGSARNSRFSNSLVGERGITRLKMQTEQIHKAEHDDFMPLLGPAEVAKWLGVSVAWVRDHATRKSPRLPAVKAGKLLRFRAADVRGFIQHCWHSGDLGGRHD